jgi:K+-sensing histidine kinase KdpD
MGGRGEEMMGSSHRASAIEVMGEVPWGTHACQFYETAEDLTDILVPYFKAGLENHELCMWVTSEPLGVEDAKASLKKVVGDLDYYIKKGQIEILDYREWYTKSGRFDPDTALQAWLEKEESALQQGFEGLRVAEDTSWLGGEERMPFATYEQEMGNVIRNYRMIAICTYSLEKCGTSEAAEVARRHQFAFVTRKGDSLRAETPQRKQVEEELMRRIQELSAFHEVSQAVSGSLGLEAVAALALEATHKVLGLDAGTLRYFDDDTQELVLLSARGLPQEVAKELYETASRIKLGQSLSGVAAKTGQPVVVDDISQDTRAVVASLRRWFHFAAHVPLKVNGKVVGMISGFSRRRRLFTPDDMKIMGSIGNVVGMGIANARLREEQRRRTHELATLHEVSQAVSGSLDLEAVAALALEATHKVLGLDAGTMRLFDKGTQELTLLAARGLPQDAAKELYETASRVKLGEGISGVAAQTGQPVVVDDISQDPRVVVTSLRQWFNSVVYLPLKVRGEVVGVISGFSCRRRTFTPGDMEIMGSIGSTVGMAIANARLFEQVKAAEREREVERMKREFIAVASHELRTPMTGVYGFAELLLNSKGLDEVQREWVGRVHKESQRTIRIIADMLNVSRIDSGLISLKLEAVTLAPIIAGLTIQLSPRYTSHSFRMDIPDGFTEVWADADRLTEVLQNLMDNAAKFSPEGGQVEVTARWDEERSQAVIAVTDWGVGIPGGGMPHVFDRFHRIRRPETEGIPGTGLGLHIAKSLVDIMQGRIWVESRENEGSTFYVALPVPKR